MNNIIKMTKLKYIYLLTSFTFGAYEFHNNYINKCNPKNLHCEKYYFTDDLFATSFGGLIGIFPPTLSLLLYHKFHNFEDNLKYDESNSKCKYN